MNIVWPQPINSPGGNMNPGDYNEIYIHRTMEMFKPLLEELIEPYMDVAHEDGDESFLANELPDAIKEASQRLKRSSGKILTPHERTLHDIAIDRSVAELLQEFGYRLEDD